MNYLVTFSRLFCIAVVFLSTTLLLGQEWKKEVLNCGDQVCFVLHGEKESILVGSSVWAKDIVVDGKEMFYDKYFYEGVTLMDNAGGELHIYGATLEKTAEEWAVTEPGVSFTDFVQAKQGWDEKFAQTVEREHVRYFTDEERKQTQVHWVNGALWQIGLDSEKEEIMQVPEGEYAFALGNKRLYITPKIVTKKGKIQHSSFLRGGPVRAAGKIQVGADGRIVWLSNDSGHYRPGDPEVAEALHFVQKHTPSRHFTKIWVRIKSSEIFNMNPPSRDYDSSEIDDNYDVPVMEWIQTFKKAGDQNNAIL